MTEQTPSAAPQGPAATATLIFSGLCLVLAGWFVFHLKPYPVALVAAVAPMVVGLVLVLAFRGGVVWFAAKPAKPTVVAAFLPALAIAVATALNVQLDNPLPVAGGAAVVGLAVAALAFARIRTSRVAAAIALGAVGGLVAYGLVALTDVGFDNGSGQVYAAHVQTKAMIGGHRPSYVLNVGPWADRPASHINVALRLYGEVEEGGSICFTRHAGALGLAWTDVGVCQSGSA